MGHIEKLKKLPPDREKIETVSILKFFAFCDIFFLHGLINS